MIEENKKIPKEEKKKKSNNWIWTICITTFLLAILLGAIADTTIQNLNLSFAIVILVVIMFIGICSDIIGMSVASADEVVFHAQASKKIKGAAEAIRLVKYADKVSSVCNDVVGDVCGIISGSISALISLEIASLFNLPISIVSLVMGALVSSITVTGKAFGKTIAVKESESIIGRVGKIISYISPVRK